MKSAIDHWASFKELHAKLSEDWLGLTPVEQDARLMELVRARESALRAEAREVTQCLQSA